MTVRGLRLPIGERARNAKLSGPCAHDVVKRPKCAKTNGFSTILVHGCAKTHVFLHIFRMALVHLSCKMVVFVLFLQFCENCSRIAHA